MYRRCTPTPILQVKFICLFFMSKRQRFVISSIILSLGFVAIRVFNIEWRFQAIGALSLLTILLSIWSLREGLAGIEWLMILLLPPMYTAGLGLIFFLLDSLWFEKFLGAITPSFLEFVWETLFRLIPSIWVQTGVELMIFGFGMYTILLTENIFTVASIRTIQLFRAAHAVGFLLTLMTAFFVYDAIWSSRLSFWWNGVLVGLVTFPLTLQGLWSVKLEEKLTTKLLVFALGISWALAQVATVLSFWPVPVTSGSLFLTACLYVILGLSQHYWDERIFAKTVGEYLAVGMVVLFTMYFTTRWGG